MKILLVDDDASVRRVLQFKLQKQGYTVITAGDGEEALAALGEHPVELLLSDIRMPKMDGLQLLEQAHNIQPQLKVVLITAHATVAQAVQAVKLGAFDYITKPFEDEELFVAIGKALEFEKLEQENKKLRGKLRRVEQHKKLIGAAPAFRELKRMISKIADTDVTVLITGESGTGKELVARTIHYESTRGDHDFVAVNCAAIPRELIESELFGHVKGAFTGAVRDKRGKFELADGGTLLLDEIGELAADLQAKLLRVLQENAVEPVGAERALPVDVRLIAATNVDLHEKVRAGAFRADLFYRLNVVPLRVPSLRERIGDIPLLAREFVRKHARDSEVELAPGLIEKLLQHDWPGNVRELENLIERMLVLRRGDQLEATALPAEFGKSRLPQPEATPAAAEEPSLASLAQVEQEMIEKALARSGGNKSKAAKLLNIPRHVLVYRLKKYGISGQGR